MQSRLARGQPRPGDAVTPCPRPTPGRRHSHASSETNLGRETQSRLTRGQPLTRDTITARPSPTLGRRHSHGSPEANPIWETQSHLVRGQPRAGDTVTAHPRPTLVRRRIHGSWLAWGRPQTSSTFSTRSRASTTMLQNVIYIYLVKINFLARSANTHCYVNY
jgi:hypothetical protein